MVLREGFEPERVTSAWEVSGKRRKVERGEGGEGEEVEEEEEDVEDLWEGVVPEMGEEVVVSFLCFRGSLILKEREEEGGRERGRKKGEGGGGGN